MPRHRVTAAALLTVVMLLSSAAGAAEMPAPPRDYSAFIAWLEAQAQDKEIPGAALAIVSKNRVLHMQTWGVRSVDDPQPVTPAALFRIASMSKTFAGTAAALLVEQALTNWDTPLVEVFPELTLGTRNDSRAITLKHVVSQSTGLMPHAFSNLLDDGLSYSRIKRRFHEIPTVCRPGTCYGYQNVVFSITADVVRETTGRSYAQYLRKELFEPLGMDSASVGLDPYRESPVATAPHQRRRGAWRVARTNPAYYSVAPASGINASLEDMSLWLQAHLGGRPDVLPEGFLEKAHEPVIPTPHGSYFNRWSGLERAYYGLGWRIFDINGYRVVHHGGSVRGYRTEMAFIPEADVGVVLLLNAESRIANEMVPAFVANLRGIE